MHKTTFIFLFLVSLFCKCQDSKQTSKKIPLSEVTFESIFGYRKSEKENTYCLLGSGFFRAPSAKYADSLLKTWIKSHPKAFLIPVHSHGPTFTDKPNSTMTYCWLVDGKDTINNYLIRTGCYPGGTMQKPPTWEEMTKNWTPEMKEMAKDEGKGKHQLHVSEADYDKFIEQIKSADKYAYDNKLGVYADKKED